MAKASSPSGGQNPFLLFSLDRPISSILLLFLAALIIKFFDSFVFRLDELIGEAILTKVLGLMLVIAYLRLAGRTLKEIGFHTSNVTAVLSLTILGFGGVYALAFAIQLLILKIMGEQAELVLSAVDPKTGLSGGLAFGIWLVVANLVNSAMEEGLFRGIMLRHALARYSRWGAIFLQAGLFATWHLSWPLRHLLDGQIPVGEVAFEAFGLVLSTLISGVVYGYFYYRTNSLWGPFLGHTINNGIFNVLFIQSSEGMQSGLEFIPFTLLFLIGHLLMIPLIRVATSRIPTPVVRPWGDFTHDAELPVRVG